MSTNIANIEAFRPEDHSIEECLLELRKYGHPRITGHKNGWFAKIEVFVTGKGVQFEVESEWKSSDPKAAINQCHARLIEAMRKIRET